MNKKVFLISPLIIFLLFLTVVETSMFMVRKARKEYQSLFTDVSFLQAVQNQDTPHINTFAAEHGIGYQKISNGQVVETNSVWTTPLQFVTVNEAKAQGVLEEDLPTTLSHIQPYIRFTRFGVYGVMPVFISTNQDGYILYKKILP